MGFGGFSGAFPPFASTGNVVVHNAFHFAGMAGAAAAGWGLVAPSSPIMAASQPLAPSLTSAGSLETASSAAVAVAPLTPSVAAHRDEIPPFQRASTEVLFSIGHFLKCKLRAKI